MGLSKKKNEQKPNKIQVGIKIENLKDSYTDRMTKYEQERMIIEDRIRESKSEIERKRLNEDWRQKTSFIITLGNKIRDIEHFEFMVDEMFASVEQCETMKEVFASISQIGTINEINKIVKQIDATQKKMEKIFTAADLASERFKGLNTNVEGSFEADKEVSAQVEEEFKAFEQGLKEEENLRAV